VFSGDDPSGRFLARYDEISHIIDNPEALRIYLGLPETPTHIVDVYVPVDTNMYVGRIGEQPNFGLNARSGFQYQLLDQIPRTSFRNIKSLEQIIDKHITRMTPGGEI
jgi:hypothetical protein